MIINPIKNKSGIVGKVILPALYLDLGAILSGAGYVAIYEVKYAI